MIDIQNEFAALSCGMRSSFLFLFLLLQQAINGYRIAVEAWE